MKKLVLLLSLMALPILTNAQSVFNKFENSKDVGSVTVSKGLLNLAAHIDIETDDEDLNDFLDIAKNIEGIEVYMTHKPDAATDLKRTAEVHLKKRRLQELMKVKDKDATVNIYVKSTNNDEVVKELFLLVDSKDVKRETVVVSITGKIELSKVGALVNKFNLPEEVKHAQNGRR